MKSRKYWFKINKFGRYSDEFFVFAKSKLEAEDKALNKMLSRFTFDEVESDGITYFLFA